jgi:hypothetical protein
MTSNIENREIIIADLRRELVGPAPAGQEIDPTAELSFDNLSESYGPWRQRGSGEEILLRDAPVKRYGIGVLFPFKVPQQAEMVEISEPVIEPEAPPDTVELETIDLDTESAPSDRPAEAEGEDLDLSLANAYQPSAFGVSFLAEFPEESHLIVDVAGGRYRKSTLAIRVAEQRKQRPCWVRSAVRLRADFPAAALLEPEPRRLVAKTTPDANAFPLVVENAVGLDLRIEVFSRPREGRQRLVTVCLVNRTAADTPGGTNERCLFQTHFTATVESPGGTKFIRPYPSPKRTQDDLEEASLALLYRGKQTFATGHGCSANWDSDVRDGSTRTVSIECFPVVEVPDTTPDIGRADGSQLQVSMATLAGLVDGNDGRLAMKEVVDLYEKWVSARRAEVPQLNAQYRTAAARHMDVCERAVGRMREGLAYLANDPQARLAFQLANRAILLQQVVTRDSPRRIDFDPEEARFSFAEEYSAPDPLNPPSGRDSWRPFQIAFLLTSIRSAAEGDAPDRQTVELIWFPTGGGKTEAYLGLTAFAIFLRRLRDPADVGVNVLMRYTLRLLTTQQFQRAAGLLCAMEYLRRQNTKGLGSATLSVGIWVGTDTTPNTREAAIRYLNEFKKYPKARNPFLLTRCPWCGAQFRRLEMRARPSGSKSRGKPDVLTPGYAREVVSGSVSATVAFKCPDNRCDFSNGLPVLVVDEDIYALRPSLIIGTIDKFAMLAWRPEASALFGFDQEGRRIASPPGLIIQDELHLISGPLGSLAGLYETVIDELCTERRTEPPVRAKIVSSTATIRRYAEQIRALYARDEVALFPPPGLDADESFFASRKTPGRSYVGVHAASLGSVQTEWVRTFTSLLQSPVPFDAEARDPWWTLLVFFNSIREMGTAHTLFQSDIPDYMKVIGNRAGMPRETRRYPSRLLELTGGLPSDEIANAISALEVACGKGPTLDVCMASNIIEVGIDIQRLSLIVVAGQPKTTSQYIQVTGRVGRRADRPGLVVTMYSPSKPRDRSHFERFRSYHQQLYAHVEPTSVTPLSVPALERAVHAVLVTYARQTGGFSTASSPYPYPKDLVERFQNLIMARTQIVDPAEAANVVRILGRRTQEWREWKRTRWSGGGSDEEIPLLRRAGEYATAEERRLSWSTQTSMRNVDAECEAVITTLYLEGGEQDA